MVWIAGISLGIQIYLACFRGRFWQLRERLLPGTPSKSDVSITAVIPARDEAASIGRAVGSLQAQQFAGVLKVIVADDQSTDGTGDAPRAAGANLVVNVQPRQPEWKGKPWAVASGIRADTGTPDFFLLTDADIEYGSARAVASLVAKADSGFDLVSVMVRLRTRSMAETF